MKSLTAARDRCLRGMMSKRDYNKLLAQHYVSKWTRLVKSTRPEWRWLCELSAYLEIREKAIR